MKKNQVSFAFVCALSYLLLKESMLLVTMNGSRPAYFPGLGYIIRNSVSSSVSGIWHESALLCWNNRPQAILSICKNPTPFPTWTINVAGKISWREIPLVEPGMGFSSVSFDIVSVCAYLGPCAEHLPLFSTWNLSKLISLAHSKSIFCSLASKVILLEKRFATVKENRQKKTEEELLKR